MDEQQNQQVPPEAQQEAPQTQQSQSSFTQAPQSKSKDEINAMALISYIGPLCLIPFFKNEKDEFITFHMKQGMVIFGCEVITWIVVAILPVLVVLGNLVGLVWLALSIIGIINVTRNEKKEIPIIGKYVNKIKV